MKEKNSSFQNKNIITVKVKAIPIQTGKIPEGSRGWRLPDFNTIGT